MKHFITLFVTLFMLGTVNGWSLCGKSGETCHVSNGLFDNNTKSIDLGGTVIARFGSNEQWSYRKFGNINRLICAASNFGNPCSGTPSGSCGGTMFCSYKHINGVEYWGNTPSAAIKQVYYKNEETIQPPHNDNNIYKLYYTQEMTFAYVMGWVKCQESLFYEDLIQFEKGQIAKYAGTSMTNCLYDSNITLNGQFGKWSICAEESQYCTFPNSYNIHSVLSCLVGLTILKQLE
jgi:hypothetical protein